MSTSPIPISTGPAGTPGLLTEIRNHYSTRQRIREALERLAAERAKLSRDTIVKWSADVNARGLDPGVAVTARDGWKRADDLVTARQQAIDDLSCLLEQQLTRYKKANPQEVGLVLRERIADLSAVRATQEKAEDETERQLKLLLDELSEVDSTARPGGSRQTNQKEAATKAAAARVDGLTK